MKYLSLFLAALVFSLTGCKNAQPDLMTPDCCGKGYNLTNLGALVYGPWTAGLSRYNEKLFLSDSEIYSRARDFNEYERILAFELFQDGNVMYWFENNWDSALIKKLSPSEDYEKAITKRIATNNQRQAKYPGKGWTVNFKDSTITIDFGKGSILIPTIEAKYTSLGSSSLTLRQTYFMDSICNGTYRKFRKVTEVNYTHPWLN